ncbi:methyl-accepting chemotaxis protein [Massilia sp. LjRoot122]|uniref:methyl-accepting chemotaxis protein n=1 Tax=Massilia sp. LjRoot122 TaxID=3342257 RepID=UPI003F4F9F3A
MSVFPCGNAKPVVDLLLISQTKLRGISMLKNLKIGVRLALSFAALGALTILLAVIAVLRMNDTAHVIAEEKRIRTTEVARLYELREALGQTGLAARNAFIYERNEDALRELELLDQQKALYLERLQQLEPLLKGRADFDKASAGLKAMAQALERPRQFRQANQMAEFGTFLVNDCSPLRRQIVADLDVVIKSIDSELDRASDEVDAVLKASKTVVLAITLAALLIGGVLAVLVTRSITRPLARATEFAEAVAVGDLSARIRSTSSDEIGTLLLALGNMRAGLAKIVHEVRSRGDAISRSSDEIAAGNQDLSARTEQQAGSLEETASSMEELTSTVKQNADNARQAKVLAEAASQVAQRGGAVIGQVVGTMSDIDASSGKISDIIGVIDGIAFQTNILALNAAVEAARAGEQGRGFAVVASEVRNLAQRSAAAAKEIKGLIHDSSEKVASGGKLVAEAGATMQEIVDSVRRVTDIMGEITSASQEQTAGIEQINQAVVEMDHATQQNAALVEEAAAAAEAMKEQAAMLNTAVAAFRTEAGQEGAPAGVAARLAASPPLRPMLA